MLSKILNTFGAKTAGAVTNLLIAIILSQFLGPEGKGQQGLIITTIAFILVFSNLVGGGTLVYLVPRYKISELFLPSYLWALLISAAAFILLLLFPVIGIGYSVHIAVLSVISGFAGINSTLLIGKEEIKASNLTLLIQPLGTIAALLFIFYLTDIQNVYAYIIAIYISFSISWFTGLVYLKKYFHEKLIEFRVKLEVIKTLFKLGFLNQTAHITQLMSFRLSYYILDLYHGEASVGIYSNAISLMESVWLISKSISLVQYARIANEDDIRYAQRITVKLLMAGFIVCSFILIPLLILPVSVYSFVFGEGFIGIKTAMWTLAPGVLIYNINILFGHYFSGRGKYHYNTIASTAGLVVSITCFYLLIPSLDIAGAGIATSISYLVTSIVIFSLFMRENQLGINEWKINKDDIRSIKEGLFKKSS